MWMTSCLSSPTQILVTSTQQVVDLQEFCLVLLSRNKTDTVRLMLLVLQFADEFEKYCSEVENTAAWGGQLEVSYLHSVTDAFTPLPVYPNVHVCPLPSVTSPDPNSPQANRSDPS